MELNLLGNTGVKVSELCLGTMTFGREATEKESRNVLDAFVEAGGNFIDTADVYSLGTSEEIVGRWLTGKRREDYIVATKVRFPMGDGPNDIGLSRKHIMDGVEASLRRLGTDYIDLYQVHAWDPLTPLDQTLGALDDLVRQGKVRYIGASNFKGWQLQKALDLSDAMGLERFVCLQPQYNLLSRATEYEVLDVCEHEGLGVIPWSPLRGGWLSGKFKRGMSEPPAGTRIEIAEQEGWAESWSAYNNEFTWEVIDALHEVAGQTGRTPAQVAINWLLCNPVVTAPIIGARNMSQLTDNLDAAGWRLEREQLERLGRASTMAVSYPYDASGNWQRSRS